MFNAHGIRLEFVDFCPQLFTKIDVAVYLVSKLAGLGLETTAVDAPLRTFGFGVMQRPAEVSQGGVKTEDQH